MMKRTWEIYGLVALGLLLIQLGSFAIVSPQLAHSTDDWHYLMLTRDMLDSGDYFYSYYNQQFSNLNIIAAEMLFPNRFQSTYYVHLIAGFLVSLGLFHILWRFFPKYAWFAFLCSGVYLVYIPFNTNYIMSWLAPYTWSILLAILSIILFIEHLHSKRRWLLLAAAVLVVYVASRAYSAILPVLYLAPLVTLYAFKRDAFKWPLTREIWLALIAWYIPIMIGTGQFVVPYLRGEETAEYFTSIQPADEFSISGIASEWVQFNANAFPLELILDTKFEYVLPGLLLGMTFALTTLIFWRRYPDICTLPGTRLLLLIFVSGLALTTLGGLGIIWAGWAAKARGQVGSAIGEALVVGSLFALLARLLQDRFKLQSERVMLGTMVVFLTLSGQWFYHAQKAMETNPPFDVKAVFLQQVLSLAPDVEDGSFLVTYGCRTSPYIPFHGGTYNTGYGAYVYEYRRGSGVQMANAEYITFNLEGVTFPGYYFDYSIPPQTYTYAEMIVFACVDEHVEILDEFPRELAPPDAAIDTYNPLARIKTSFIPDARETLLFR